MFSSITNFISGFRTDPAGSLITLVYLAIVILFSLIIHECAHGYVALKCGDPTAKMLGRLTLDPRKHLDPIGTICMVFLRFGWAKPVPVNPRNFRNYRRDYIFVSLAGIIVNLLVCIISMLISALLTKYIWSDEIIQTFSDYEIKETFLNVYYSGKYIPLVKIPIDVQNIIRIEATPAIFAYNGMFVKNSVLYLKNANLLYIQRLFLMLAQMNLGLAIFNLLPVPPLDGFRFMDQFVFKGQLRLTPQTMQYIHIGFLIVCMSGMLSGLLTTVNSAVFGWLSQLFALII